MYSEYDTYLKVGGLSHSETPGSKLVWQLPEAYRSLLRPSSLASVKASTTCVSNRRFFLPANPPIETGILAGERLAIHDHRSWTAILVPLL